MIISSIKPHDYFTWFLEVFPAIIGLVIILFSNKKFPLTNFTLTCLLIHAIILMIGGHYTYAQVPFFDYIKEFFELERNNYDKVGHFAQGFIPSMIAREIIIRKNIIQISSWRNFFIICFCLALSAIYELIEWWVALATNEASNDFLGTQGYIWDTQSDMAWALFGAIFALIFLSKYHDKQLKDIMK